MKPPIPPRTSFLDELRRRKVFRVAAVYAATGYVVLEAADLILPRLGVPDWAMSLLIVTGLLVAVGVGLSAGWLPAESMHWPLKDW